MTACMVDCPHFWAQMSTSFHSRIAALGSQRAFIWIVNAFDEVSVLYDDSFVELKSARFCGKSVPKSTCCPGDTRLAQDGEEGFHVVLAHFRCRRCLLCHARVV